MIELLFDPNAWAALVTLSALEIVLGIDNVIFISVHGLAPAERRRPSARARSAWRWRFVFRIVLLFALTWLMRLTAPIVTVFGMGMSWRDIILIGGGLFLIAKATHEIHAEVEARDEGRRASRQRRPARSSGWSSQIIVDRPRVLAGFDHHRDRHGAGYRDHDRRRRDRHDRHVCRVGPGRRASSPIIRPPRCWRWRSWC